MPVDPALAPILEAVAQQPEPDRDLPVEQLRENAHQVMETAFAALAEPAAEIAKVEDLLVPVADGEVGARVYTPLGHAPFPGHVYFHGGGFWLGNLDSFDIGCRDVCAGAGCVVVSVDYRLAPEHKFPTATEDCYAALCWTVEHAAELGIDPSRVSVGGASAGGNLAAVVSMMARDRGGPSLVLQVLEIPVTDLTMSQPSVEENGVGFLLTRESMEQYRDFYLADPADAKEPYASPLLAPDLTNLPPAVVMTAEFDPLRDEGEAYAARLADAGVPVTQWRWEGHVHGSCEMTGLVPSAREWRRAVIDALRAAYA